MYYIVFTMYRLLRHEIKTVQITFYFNILFKSQSHPPIPTHPSYKTVKQFAQTSETPCPEIHVHAYPMSIELGSPRILCASWISWGCTVTRLA